MNIEDKRLCWYDCLRAVREFVLPEIHYPVRIQRRALVSGDGITWFLRDPDRFSVSIDTSQPEYLQVHALVHEMAHVMRWAQDVNEDLQDNHDEEWGRIFALLYQELLDW